MAGVR
jgi:hypothetical protein